MNKELISRTINYYKFDFDYTSSENNKGDLFVEFFNELKAAKTIKELMLDQYFEDRRLFLQDIEIVENKKLIKAKFRSLRNDIFPELFNSISENITEISDDLADKSIVETTHIVFDYSDSDNISLAIEFNKVGPKTKELLYYLQHFGQVKSKIITVKWLPIIKNNLAKIKDEMGGISELIVKVEKGNLDDIKKVDDGVYEALKKSVDNLDCEVAEISLKFDYKIQNPDSKVVKVVNKVIELFQEDKVKSSFFNVFKIRAENHLQNNNLDIFDLLLDKAKSKIKVEKNGNHKTVISSDIFEKMIIELQRKVYL